MNKERTEEKIEFLLEKLGDEIDRLIYNKPKCDFEHIWNCAIDKCLEVVDSWKDDDDYLELNMDKFKPTFEIKGKEKKEKKRNVIRKNN